MPMLFRQMISVRTILRFRFYLGVSFGLLALLLAVLMGLVVYDAAEEWPAVTPEQKAMTSIPINRTHPRGHSLPRGHYRRHQEFPYRRLVRRAAPAIAIFRSPPGGNKLERCSTTIE